MSLGPATGLRPARPGRVRWTPPRPKQQWWTSLWWKQLWWRHPESVFVPPVLIAWSVVLVAHRGQPAHDHHGGVAGIGVALLAWPAMVVAMMLPTVLVSARSIALNGLWRRRLRGPAEFVAGYLAVWLAVGLPAVALAATPATMSGWPLAVALAAAAVWETTRRKQRALRACHRLRSLPPAGPRADRACVGEGIRIARHCVGSCGPMMAAMALAPHPVGLWLMPVLSVAIWAQTLLVRAVERLGWSAAGLFVIAVAVLGGVS